MIDSPETLTDALASLGYSHRAAANGTRSITRDEDGVVIGRMTAGEGWTFVRERRALIRAQAIVDLYRGERDVAEILAAVRTLSEVML